MQTEDRRQFTRLQAYHCVKYRVLSSNGQDNIKQPDFLPAAIRDISKGGVCLRIEEKLPKLTLVELKINFPHLNKPVSAVSKVVWVTQRGLSRRYEVGLEFVDIDKATQDIIDGQIKNVYDTILAHRKIGLFRRIFHRGRES